MPRISVLIPVYNSERYLSEALQSVLAEHDSDMEVVIVDDGSTDRTLEILQQFASSDERIQLISRPNTGIVGALNDGLAACTGTYIARMDADDIVYPGRFNAQQAYLDEYPECVGVGSWVQYIDPDGEPIWTWRMTSDPGAIKDHLLNGTIAGLVHPAMMLRREAVMAVGAYRFECQYVEDYDLFLRLLDYGTFTIIEKSLLGYRQHLGSINATKDLNTRMAITNRLLADARTRAGLAPKEIAAKPSCPETILLEWVRLALEEGNFSSAQKHANALGKRAEGRRTAWQARLLIAKARMRQVKIRLGAARRAVLKQ